MSGTKGFAVSISAVDNASKTLDGINKRLAAMSAPAERFNKSVAKFADVSGVNKLGQGMQSLAGRSLDVFRSLDRVSPALAGITSAASLGGMATLVQRWGQLGQQVANTSQRLGVPTDRLTALRGAARLAGASAEDLDSGLGSLDEKLRGATFHGDSTAIQTFNQLGVGFGQIGVKARGAGEAFADVAEGVKRLYDSGEAGRGAALRAAQNLGLEALFPLLVKGRRGVQDLSAEAAKLGVVISPEAAKRATDLRLSFTQVAMTAEGLGNAISDKLGGPVIALNERLVKWVGNNKDVIATDVAGWVKSLGSAIDGLNTTKLDILIGAAIGYKLGGLRGALLGAAGGAVYGSSAGPGAIPVDPRSGAPVAPDADSRPFTWWNPGTWLHHSSAPASAGAAVPPQRPHPAAAGSAAYGEQQREHDFWKSKGLKETQIAGPLASVAAESGFDPSKWNRDHTSYGLYQYTGARLRALQARYGTDEPSADQQREFAWNELQTSERASLNALLATNTRPDAGRAFTGFERPAGQDQRAEERAQAASLFAGTSPDAQAVAAPQVNVGGGVQIDLHVHGAPAGTTAKVATTGQAQASPPRIAMPMSSVVGNAAMGY